MNKREAKQRRELERRIRERMAMLRERLPADDFQLVLELESLINERNDLLRGIDGEDFAGA